MYRQIDRSIVYTWVACRAKAGESSHHKPTAEAKHTDLSEPMLWRVPLAAIGSKTGHFAQPTAGVSLTPLLLLLLLLHSSQSLPPTALIRTTAKATTGDCGGGMTSTTAESE